VTDQTARNAQPSGTPLLETSGFRAVIRFNRPELHNRLEPEDLDVLDRMLESLDRREDLRVLVLTGAGKTFSSGYHLGALAESLADSDAPHVFERVANRLENLPVLTVAALNGSVYGGACDMALACDFRIGVTGSDMFVPASRLGVHYYSGGLYRYVTRLGLDAAKKILLTSSRIEAEEMLRIGYLNELVEPGELEARVNDLASLLELQAPLAVRGMKRALNQIARGELDHAATTAAILATLRSEDLREGLAAWTERRKPRFQGR
jgi:enoyl-CoA hydratase